MRSCPTNGSDRKGFTLVELLVAMAIFLVLSFITIGALKLGLTGENIRSAGRLIQSKVEGARDRAIYRKHPVGVRLLVDGANPSTVRSLVYVESVGEDKNDSYSVEIVPGTVETVHVDARLTQLDLGAPLGPVPVVLHDIRRNGEANVEVGSRWAALYDRGLIGPGSVIKAGDRLEPMTIHPDGFDPIQGFVASESVAGVDWNGDGDQFDEAVRVISDHGATNSNIMQYVLTLGNDVMADEEPLELPNGTCIYLVESLFPTIQSRNRLDLMFSPQGQCIQPDSGLVHLYLCDVADALEGTVIGSPTTPNDYNGDGQLDDRHGPELGVTVAAASGRAWVHPIGLGSNYPDKWEQRAYVLHERCSPSVYNGYIYVAVVAGTTGTAEPAWTTSGLINDGSVVWRPAERNMWSYSKEGATSR